MLGWIVALILLFCLVVCICLYYRTREYDSFNISNLRNENQELRKNLRELKGTGEYKSSRRLEDLERYIDQHIQRKKADTAFAATFEAVGIDSIEDSLHQMITRAEYEILIVSPWIKEGAWNRIKARIFNFCRNGGEFKVFIKGNDEDFLRGSSDRSVIDEIRSYGGVVTFVPKLHAKLYVIDRREALITSANLTRSGFDFSYEAGVWTCNPAIVKDACHFVEKLAS